MHCRFYWSVDSWIIVLDEADHHLYSKNLYTFFKVRTTKMLLLLLILVATLASGCNLTACASRFLDMNHDNAVSAEEIDAFIARERAKGTASCLKRGDAFFAAVNGTMAVASCDTNGDGLITEADNCPSGFAMRTYLCALCNVCTPPAERKKVLKAFTLPEGSRELHRK